MDSASVGNELDAVLMDRYPGIVYQLHFVDFVPFVLQHNPDGKLNAVRGTAEFLHTQNIEREMQHFLSSYDLDPIEVFYLYGIGLGYHFAALQPWLNEKKERLLIILEHDRGAIDACLKGPFAAELIAHPQVQIHFVESTRKISSLMKELIETFPTEHVEIAALESYAGGSYAKKRSFQRMRLQLYRFTAVSHANMVEAIYSHKLLNNLLKNILHWPSSFFANGLKGKFKDVPAIICGAGPSLSKTFDQLKSVDDRALIIAGGSTISALSNQGIVPHIGLAIDPNPEEFDRLKSASSFEMPLLYAMRLEPHVFNTCNGDKGYILAKTGNCCEEYFENALGLENTPIGPELGPEAFSVTTLCIALAVEMGCNPILLNGIDLAYTDMQRYATGVLPSSQVFLDEMQKMKKAGDRLLKRKDIFGKPAYTLVKWVMESECIASYAKRHPDIQFLNVTQGGLGFAHIPNHTFAEACNAHLKEQHDLHASLHTLAHNVHMHCSRGKILHEMREVYNSLLRAHVISEEMLKELDRIKADPSIPIPSGKATILEIDFQEEKAFECLLFPIEIALASLLNRIYYLSPFLSEEEKRLKQCDRLIAKWKRYTHIIESKKEVFATLLDEQATYRMV